MSKEEQTTLSGSELTSAIEGPGMKYVPSSVSPLALIGTLTDGDILIKQRYVSGLNGFRLFYRHVSPPAGVQRKASVCIVHGFGEHSARFLHVARYYATRHFDVHLIDLRGFGYSGGARAYARVTDLLQDVEVLLSQVDKSLPCFMIGHSMGGMLVLNYLTRRPFVPVAGVIATSAMLRLHPSREIPRWKQFLLGCIADRMKEFLVSAEIDPTNLSREGSEVIKVISDRLSIPIISLKLASELMTGCRTLMDQCHKLQTPALFMHGTDDLITDPAATEEFYRRAGSADKTLRLYPNAYHELHQDSDRELWKKETADWMEARVRGAPNFAAFTPKMLLLYSTPKPRGLKFYLGLLLYAYFILRNWRSSPHYTSLVKRLLVSLLGPLLPLLKRFTLMV
eukprot:GILK01003860.1.p1 GENE.GILK01003860.1~~GILK01003860.1.p1  ORF type:complete len:396 (+),score=30.72 GILK01003860.1:61-1248(+)